MNKRFNILLAIGIFFFLNTQLIQAAPGDTTLVVPISGLKMTYTGNYDSLLVLPDTATHSYRKIYLHYILGRYSCPAGTQYCGAWDYLTSVYILPAKHKGDSVELARVITPYASSMPNTWTNEYVIDITDYAPLLKDSSTIRVNYGGYSFGFTLKIELEFIAGTPPRNTVGVKNIYSSRTHGTFWYGSTPSIETYLPADTVTMASPATNAMLRVVATGHGSDSNNCSEFCAAYYQLLLNNTMISQKTLWRNDCGINDFYQQPGTWPFQRANWCPGAKVLPIDHELTSYVAPNTPFSVNLNWQPYTSPGGGSNYVIEAQLFTYTAPNFTLDASLEDIKSPSKQNAYYRSNAICSNPVVIIRNTGSTTLTSLTFTYGIRGGSPQTYTWTGSLPFMQTQEVTLPATAVNFPALSEQNFDVSISAPNGGTDQYSANDKISSTFNYPPQFPSKIAIKFRTNATTDTTNSQHSETNWRIVDALGNVVASRVDNPINTIMNDTVTLAYGCYTFQVTVQQCDGVNWWLYADYTVNPGVGYILFRNAATNASVTLPHYNGGDFGCGFNENFTVGYYMDVPNLVKDASLDIFPNPSNGSFTVNYDLPSAQLVNIQVYSTVGKEVYNRQIDSGVSNSQELDLSALAPGIYLFEMQLKDNRLMRRIVIAK